VLLRLVALFAAARAHRYTPTFVRPCLISLSCCYLAVVTLLQPIQQAEFQTTSTQRGLAQLRTAATMTCCQSTSAL
jgi:hypothetical protein